MKVTYSGIDISYMETENVWRFELRGRERSAESLTKAKEAIDKPEPKDKKPFTRIKAYLKDYSDQFHVVEVTSVAESRSYSNRQEFWISNKGNREKKDAHYLYPVNPNNDVLVAGWNELHEQQKKLEVEMRALVAEMQSLKVDA